MMKKNVARNDNKYEKTVIELPLETFWKTTFERLGFTFCGKYAIMPVGWFATNGDKSGSCFIIFDNQKRERARFYPYRDSHGKSNCVVEIRHRYIPKMVYTGQNARAFVKDNASDDVLVSIGSCERTLRNERELLHKMNGWLNQKYPNWGDPIAYW